MLALSIRPPWAWAIIHAGKDVENRSRRCHYRGRFLGHASLDLTEEDFGRALQALAAAGEDAIIPRPDEFETGGFVGSVELVVVSEKFERAWYHPGSSARVP